EREPVPPAHALGQFGQGVAPPQLAASGKEAQDKAGSDIAEMVRVALRGAFVPYAVNVPAAAEVTEVVRPFMPLAEKLGAVLTGLGTSPVRSLEAEYLGALAEEDTRVLT